MKTNKLLSFTSVLIVMTLSACAKSTSSDSAATSSSTAAVTAVALLQSKVASLAVPIAGSSLASLAKRGEAGFHAKSLTTPTSYTVSDYNADSRFISDSRDSGGSCAYNTFIGLKTRMGLEFNETATRCNGSTLNMFGKVKYLLQNACLLGAFLPEASSDLLPASGNLTYSGAQMVSALAACDVTSLGSPSASDIGGVTMSFTTPSDTSVYDRVLSLSFTYQSETTVTTAAIKFNSSAVNLAIGRSAERAVISLDKTSGVMKAEYISGISSDYNGYYFHRMYSDETIDFGRILSDISSNAFSTDYRVAYVVSANPQSGTTGALSAFFSGWSASTYDASTVNGCASMSTGALTTASVTGDNAFTCGTLDSKTVDAYTIFAPNDSTAVTSSPVYTTVSASGWNTISSTNLPSLTWDSSTMLTQAP